VNPYGDDGNAAIDELVATLAEYQAELRIRRAP